MVRTAGESKCKPWFWNCSIVRVESVELVFEGGVVQTSLLTKVGG